VFDRSAPLPTGGYLEQADGTAWMALFAQNMIEIGIQLAAHDFRCLAPAGGTPRWCSTTGGGAEIGARDHRRSGRCNKVPTASVPATLDKVRLATAIIVGHSQR
jgi:hypothetical protein